MSQRGGLRGIWEDLNSYLTVDIEVCHDESPDTTLPVVVKFTVTNTGQAREDSPEIAFEEVQLEVGVPPNLSIERVENLAAGQSFTYEHPCTYEAIMQMQWTVEGRVSPTALLQFRRKPNGIERYGQFPIKAYFDFLEQLKLHQWLSSTVKSLVAPGPDTTLAEMKEKEDTLRNSIAEIGASAKRLQDFLGLVDYRKNREDLLRHHRLVQEYFSVTDRSIGELMKILRENRVEQFEKVRGRTVAELAVRADNLDEATEALAKKLGLLQTNTADEDSEEASSGVEPPPPVGLREIDLHGKTVEEAIPVVEAFLKESYRDSVRRVRIIHGKGIFVLQKAIREHLATHRLVKPGSISSANKDHGGEGATEAELVDFSADQPE